MVASCGGRRFRAVRSATARVELSREVEEAWVKHWGMSAAE
jgi:hypothetical protein